MLWWTALVALMLRSREHGCPREHGIVLGGDQVRAALLVGGGVEAKRVRLAAVDSRRGALDRRWQPEANSDVWELTPDAAGGRLYAGGAFTRISGAPREHFARFSG